MVLRLLGLQLSVPMMVAWTCAVAEGLLVVVMGVLLGTSWMFPLWVHLCVSVAMTLLGFSWSLAALVVSSLLMAVAARTW